MTDPTTDLIAAFAVHRDKLRSLEALAKITTDPMLQILTLELQSFNKRMLSWTIAASLHKIISPHDGQPKEP